LKFLFILPNFNTVWQPAFSFSFGSPEGKLALKKHLEPCHKNWHLNKKIYTSTKYFYLFKKKAFSIKIRFKKCLKSPEFKTKI